MELSFATRRLARELADDRALLRAYGDRAKRLKLRLDLLAVASCLDDVPPTPPTRRHELAGEWVGHFAVDVTANWRLIFRPNHDPIPRNANGGVDLKAITAIEIVAIEDYHS
jgi:proteic killer suppression protein